MGEETQPGRPMVGLYRGTCAVCGTGVWAVQPLRDEHHRAPCRRCANPAALAAHDIGAGVELRLLAPVDLELVEGTTVRRGD